MKRYWVKLDCRSWAYCSQPAGSTFPKVLFAKNDHFSFILALLAKSSVAPILGVSVTVISVLRFPLSLVSFENFGLLVLTEGADRWCSVVSPWGRVLMVQEGLVWCVNDKLSAQVLPQEVLVMESGELSELGKTYIPPRVLHEALCVISSVAGLDADSFEPEKLALEMLLVTHHPSVGK